MAIYTHGPLQLLLPASKTAIQITCGLEAPALPLISETAGT
jgi:hypothetical protein